MSPGDRHPPGRLLYDGELTGLVSRFAAHKTITVELVEGATVADAMVSELLAGAPVERTPVGLSIRVPRTDTALLAGRLLSQLPVADLTIEEPSIDQIIEDVFTAPALDGPADEH